jgi:hypothetical protein
MSALVLSAAIAVGASSTAMAQTAASNRWIMAGFVGSNFGAATTAASADFGGQIAYLWRGMFGVEGLADFSPHLKIDNAGLSEFPEANAYMTNAIFALPLGNEGQFQPYVSGGWGGIQLRTSVFNAFLPHTTGQVAGTTAGEEVSNGGDIGAGVMGFAGRIGFRGDVRYFKASHNSNPSTTDPAVSQFTESVLSGLDFWRANIGIAVRW